MIDMICAGVIAFFVFVGVGKGILSQGTALFAIFAALVLSKPIGESFKPAIIDNLGAAPATASFLAYAFAAVVVYFGFRFIGYLIERFLIKQVQELKIVNKVGGGAFGGLKAVFILCVVFFFVSLVPSMAIKSQVPGLLESKAYQWSEKYNPLGSTDMITRVRGVFSMPEEKTPVGTKKKKSFLPSMKKTLDGSFLALIAKKHGLEKLLNQHQEKDGNFSRKELKKLKESDAMKEVVENIMKDEDMLRHLLEQFSTMKKMPEEYK